MGELIPLAAIIVGGMLAFPMVVGSVLHQLRQGRDPMHQRHADVERLEAELQQTREELRRLSERQQFLEALVEKRQDPTALPR